MNRNNSKAVKSAIQCLAFEEDRSTVSCDCSTFSDPRLHCRLPCTVWKEEGLTPLRQIKAIASERGTEKFGQMIVSHGSIVSVCVQKCECVRERGSV